MEKEVDLRESLIIKKLTKKIYFWRNKVLSNKQDGP
jgi:hypothetical protein